MEWKDRRILARFRCGDETKAREYWEEEGEKRCTLCRKKEEDLRHVIEECEITRGPKDIGKTLNETGKDLTELKAIMEKREMHSKETKSQSCNSF